MNTTVIGSLTVISSAVIQDVSELIRTDRQQDVQEYIRLWGTSESAVQGISAENLTMFRVCVKWNIATTIFTETSQSVDGAKREYPGKTT